MTTALPVRHPSIGDDGDAVLAADAVFGVLPDFVDDFHLVALLAHGYAWRDHDHDRYVLTADGIALRDRYAAIRHATTAAARPHGPLTEPSIGEIRDARTGAYRRDDVAVPLSWPYGRAY